MSSASTLGREVRQKRGKESESKMSRTLPARDKNPQTKESVDAVLEEKVFEIRKPRKIIFDKQRPEYAELLLMLKDGSRNKNSRGMDARETEARHKRPYRTNMWFRWDLEWRRELAAKQEGLAETLKKNKICEAKRKVLNDFYKFVSQPVYKRDDMTLREAFCIGVQKRPWHAETTEFFNTEAPYHMVQREHFRSVLCKYFNLGPWESFGSHKLINRLFNSYAVTPPRNHQGSPVTPRLDYREIVCGLKALQDAPPEFARENMRFFLDVYEQRGKASKVAIDDFVKCVQTCAVTSNDRVLAESVRATINKRQAQLNEKKFPLDFWNELATPRPKAGDSGLEIDFESHLPMYMTVKEIMVFLDENPLILEEFGEQQMTCLSLSHRTRVIVDLCVSCERRKNNILDNMRLKKAVYYWHVATFERTILQWRSHAARLIQIRKNCEHADHAFYKKYGSMYVRRWLSFTKRKTQYRKDVEVTMLMYAQMTFKHMWARWRLWTGMSRKMNEYNRMKKRQAYVHGAKGLVKTWHKLLSQRSKGGVIHAWFRWNLVNGEREEFQEAIKYYHQYLQRYHLRAWIRYFNEVIKEQKIEELRKQEQQQYLLQMQEEGERLLKEQEEAFAAEAKRLLDLENAEIDARIAEEDRVTEQRRLAEISADKQLVLRMQAETRKAWRDQKEAERRMLFDRKWDSMEAAMATKAKMRAEEYMESESGTRRLKQDVLEVIEAVSSNVQNKEEREELMRNPGVPGRFGRVRWIIRYDRQTASKYYLNTETGDREIPDDLVQMNKKARLKNERIATDNYIDTEMIKAREKAEDLRQKAWEKDLRVEAAEVIHRFWTRAKAWKELKSQQWIVEIRKAKRLKELQDPLALKIQTCWRRRYARIVLARMVDENIQVYRTEKSKGNLPYYFNAITGQTTWEKPLVLLLIERDKEVQKQIRDRHFAKKNRRRDRMRAIMKREKKEEEALRLAAAFS